MQDRGSRPANAAGDSEPEGSERTDTAVRSPEGAPPLRVAEPPPEDEGPGALARFFGGLKRYLKPILLVAIAAGAYYGYGLWHARLPYEWSGAVEVHTASIGSRVGGRVKEIKVEDGQPVKQGDVLVVLDDAALAAQKAQDEAELARAQATLEKLQHGSRPEEIAQAAAKLAEAKAALSSALGQAAQTARDAARAAELFKGGALATGDNEAKQAAAHAAADAAGEARAQAEYAEAALKLARAGTRPEEIAAAKADVALAQAKLAEVQNQLDELSIRAARDGRVERVLVRPGDILKPDAPAATVVEAGQLYVKLYVPETELGKIHVGMEVPITVDSYPNRSFKGKVEYISQEGEFTPQRLVTTEDRASEFFATKIAVLEGEDDLRAGMTAFVRLPKH